MSKKDRRAVNAADAANVVGAVADQMSAAGDGHELAAADGAIPPGELLQQVTPTAGPTKETKHERFRRLAVDRVNKSIVRMLQVKRLANKANYEYTTDDVRKVITALSETLDSVADGFSGQIEPEESFTF